MRFFNNLLEPAQKLTKSLNIPLHPVGTILFHTFRNMTIDIQREGRCRMSQISLHRFDIISVLERQDGVGMPLRYNNDKPEKPRNFKGLEVYQADFSSFSNPKNQATKPLFRRGC